MDINTVIGSAAAFCTTVANFPQLKKCWDTGKAGDLSLKMFIILSVGLVLWAVYGFMQQDYVIIAANVVSLAMVLGILYFKVRESYPGTIDAIVPIMERRRPQQCPCLRSSLTGRTWS